ncbi:hypothetical protein [Streptomyces sp. UNOC14_S4]|uniref:hypothetical protein n=1 Tax=Streptomyces sp. UNOC14_S4 TaxID=2872340 RepID=UPI001E389AC4|nr:hypothetical protein [Streptomyces sp. UNOC14_S4]MCC3769398.1 hypothetical protein [Streptomyces sp. UNOC14_S4]
MKLGIGDVVRDRNGKTLLGSVAGITSQENATYVVVHLPGGEKRLAAPSTLEVVARRVASPTTGQSVVSLVVLLVGFLAAYIGCRSAQDLGADWLLTVLCGAGAYSAVMTLLQMWLRVTGPRRFRV